MLITASVVAICGLGSFFFSLIGICAKPVPAPPRRGKVAGRQVLRQDLPALSTWRSRQQARVNVQGLFQLPTTEAVVRRIWP
jgi:hypothetical protein